MKNRIRKTLTGFSDYLNDGLRRLCGEITPDKRIIVVLTMFVVFAAASLYISVSTIYNLGKKKATREFMEIEHLHIPKSQVRDSTGININSIKEHLKYQEYGKGK